MKIIFIEGLAEPLEGLLKALEPSILKEKKWALALESSLPRRKYYANTPPLKLEKVTKERIKHAKDSSTIKKDWRQKK